MTNQHHFMRTITACIFGGANALFLIGYSIFSFHSGNLENTRYSNASLLGVVIGNVLACHFLLRWQKYQSLSFTEKYFKSIKKDLKYLKKTLKTVPNGSILTQHGIFSGPDMSAHSHLVLEEWKHTSGDKKTLKKIQNGDLIVEINDEIIFKDFSGKIFLQLPFKV